MMNYSTKTYYYKTKVRLNQNVIKIELQKKNKKNVEYLLKKIGSLENKTNYTVHV